MMAGLAKEVTSGLLCGVTYTVHLGFHKVENCLKGCSSTKDLQEEYVLNTLLAGCQPLQRDVNSVAIGVAQLQPIQQHKGACQS